MSDKMTTTCFCGAEFVPGEEAEISPSMFYVDPRTCSSDCHNKWVLGHYDGSAGVGDGWVPIINKLHEDIKELCPEYVITQIKEKFGTLRYYCSYREPESDTGVTKDEQYAIERLVSELGTKIDKAENPDDWYGEDERPEPVYESSLCSWKKDYILLKDLLDRLSPIAALIRKAEEGSARTCEKCGKPGELDNSRYWLLTLCADCKSQRG